MAEKQQNSTNLGGRPSTVTPEVLAKLEQAFAIDATVQEALSYAEISKDAYYRYLESHPEFRERIEDLRQKPILKARQTIVKSLDNPKDAQWYLERKKKLEFAQRTELTGQEGESITIQISEVIAKKNNLDVTNTKPNDNSGGST